MPMLRRISRLYFQKDESFNCSAYRSGAMVRRPFGVTAPYRLAQTALKNWIDLFESLA